MTKLESDKVTINKTAKEVYDFLSDFNNFKKLMPEQVVDWKSTADECTFSIKGMATLGMKIVEKTPNSLIKVIRNGSAPFDFTMTCIIDDLQNQCAVQLVFDADLNPMMKMMAAKPLTNFLNILVAKLKNI
jgi:hypothetical protein